MKLALAKAQRDERSLLQFAIWFCGRLFVFRRRHVLWSADLVVRLNSEHGIVRKCVPVMVVMAVQIEENLRVPRQPQLRLHSVELNRTIINRYVVTNEFQVFHWLPQVRFHVKDVKAVCRNPNAALERHFHCADFCLPQTKVGSCPRLLGEVYDPRGLAPPLAQTLASKIQRFGKTSLEYIHAEPD